MKKKLVIIYNEIKSISLKVVFIEAPKAKEIIGFLLEAVEAEATAGGVNILIRTNREKSQGKKTDVIKTKDEFFFTNKNNEDRTESEATSSVIILDLYFLFKLCYDIRKI